VAAEQRRAAPRRSEVALVLNIYLGQSQGGATQARRALNGIAAVRPPFACSLRLRSVSMRVCSTVRYVRRGLCVVD
jgi:hypothetical protein